MKLALPHITEPVFALTPELLKTGFDEAKASPRRRIILPMHRSPEATVQRMLNFMLPGTYIRPHLHPLPHATETIQVLRGGLVFFIFDDEGNVTHRYHLEAGETGLIDIESNLWHGFAVTGPETVVLEIKRGPYDQKQDKVFPTWAPEETSPDAAAYLNSLLG